MIKKITSSCIALLLILGLSNIISAQTSNHLNLQKEAELYKGQKEVTESEFKAYIELIPKLNGAVNDSRKLMKLFKDADMDTMRFNFVSMKIPFAYSAVPDEEAWKIVEQQFPPVFRITKNELNLAKKYIKELEAIITPLIK